MRLKTTIDGVVRRFSYHIPAQHLSALIDALCGIEQAAIDDGRLPEPADDEGAAP